MSERAYTRLHGLLEKGMREQQQVEMEERVAEALRPNEGECRRQKPARLLQQMITKRQSTAMIGADGVLRTKAADVSDILAEHCKGIEQG